MRKNLNYMHLMPSLFKLQKAYASILTYKLPPAKIRRHCMSETEARRMLHWIYDYLRRAQVKKHKHLLICQYEPVQSFFESKPDWYPGGSFINFALFNFLQDYIDFVKEQFALGRNGEQSFCDSLYEFRHFLERPIGENFLRHIFMPQLEFIYQHPDGNERYRDSVHVAYLSLACFIAAKIVIRPQLAQSLRQEYRGVPLRQSLLLELIGEVTSMTPELFETDLSFKQLPYRAASNIRTRLLSSRTEILTDGIVEADVYRDNQIVSHNQIDISRNPQEIVLARDEVNHYTKNLTPRRRVMAQLKASGYTHREIAASLDIGTESVKTHITLLKEHAEELYSMRG